MALYVRKFTNVLRMKSKDSKNINFPARLENSKTVSDIFEVVKAAVWYYQRKSRGGLMLGIADLGNHPQGFLGAFYPVGSNVIVMNKIPLKRIKETNPELYKPYIFHVLLHEYLHTLGYLSESGVRQMVIEITRNIMGEEHPATMISLDTNRFFKNLVYPDAAWKPEDTDIELIWDFDKESASYIY